jgi:hypothetical protein
VEIKGRTLMYKKPNLPKIYDKINSMAPTLFGEWYAMDGSYGSLIGLMYAELGEDLDNLSRDAWDNVAQYWEEALDGRDFIKYCIKRAEEG